MNESVSYQQALFNLVSLRRVLKTDGIDDNSLTLICSAIITHIAMCYEMTEKIVHQNAKLYDPHFPDEI